MSVWFSASAVVPQLAAEWSLSPADIAWLTMSVQLGFVVGAFGSAVLNLPDRFAPHLVIGWASLGAAVANLTVVAAESFEWAVAGRLLTGIMLAGVYPPAMKLVATWTSADRGAAIGMLIGALTIGSALPHLVTLAPSAGTSGLPPWESVLLVTSSFAGIGGILVATGVREGPHLAEAAPFNWRYVGAVLRHKPTRLANYGYLGHMWELYAVWVWVPMLILEAYKEAGLSVSLARLAGFAVIATGAVGCIVAGFWADKRGRTTVTMISLAISGSCCLIAGSLTDAPYALSLVCLIWGVAVVADSGQFSAAVTELADRRYVGTALTLQTSMGFLLTLVSIRLIPQIAEPGGWGPALSILAVGPLFAIWSMARLRKMPQARRMASGNR